MKTKPSVKVCAMDTLSFEQVEKKIITLRNTPVILDSDVAGLYGVETKRVNEAVSNNPDKFPTGYIIRLEKTEWDGLKSKFSTSIKGRKTKLPFAFTERGFIHAGNYPEKRTGYSDHPRHYRCFLQTPLADTAVNNPS